MSEAAFVAHPSGVILVHHPASPRLLADLADGEVPRILIVPADAPPPRCVDPLEDWIREPVDPDELEIRCRTLEKRAFTRQCAP
jgi:hypothetical protein